MAGLSQFASFHAFLYTGGNLHDLGVPPGYTASTGDGIDDAGDVIVNAESLSPGSPSSYRHAFLYHNGVFNDSITPGNVWSTAFISRNGQIAGIIQIASGQYYSFIDVGGMQKDLGSPSGYTEFGAVAINDSGDVIGTAINGTDTSTSHGVLYHAGTWTDLGTLGTGYSRANGLNDLDQVTGTSSVGTIEHAFLYSQGKMQDLGTLPGYFDSAGNAINDTGLVVGTCFGFSSDSTKVRAFIYAHGQMQDLNSLLPADSGWVLQSANAINSAGQIVGDGLYQGQDQAFLLSLTS